MTSKNAVIGNKAHPFYKWVVAQAGETAAPRWNFHKYLIDGKGELAGAFPSKVAPEALAREIERELKA
jgi:glutathione peroxidase